MDSDQTLLSPAKRSRRCALVLLAFLALVAAAYIGLHADRFSDKGIGGPGIAASVATSERHLTSSTSTVADQDHQSSSLVQVSMADKMASVYLVAKSH